MGHSAGTEWNVIDRHAGHLTSPLPVLSMGVQDEMEGGGGGTTVNFVKFDRPRGQSTSSAPACSEEPDPGFPTFVFLFHLFWGKPNYNMLSQPSV